MMRPPDILREIAYPFTDMAVLFAMIGFLLLGKLAMAAGLLGLWLGLILLPAFFDISCTSSKPGPRIERCPPWVLNCSVGPKTSGACFR